jgi:Bacterial Ig-like domain (group 2)/Fibronectin type III domain
MRVSSSVPVHIRTGLLFSVLALTAAGVFAACDSETAAPPGLAELLLTPANSTVEMGQTVQFRTQARLTDGTQSDVPATYTADLGTITTAGLYTATSAGQATVTARVVTGETVTARVVVNQAPPTLARVLLVPDTARLQVGQALQFQATGLYDDGLERPLSVTYEATGGVMEATGRYTAGAAAGSYRAIARSASGQADTSAIIISQGSGGSAVLTSIELTPPVLTLISGQQQQYQVTGRYSDGTIADVTAQAMFTTTGGTITSPGGSFTAGTAAGTFAVTARMGTLEATASVTVLPRVLIAIALAPQTVTLAAGTSQLFSVIGTYSDGSTEAVNATFTATGGTITSGGLYTAGATAGSYQVIATAGSRVDTAAVTVTAVGVTLTSVSLTPGSVSLVAGGTQQFTVTGTYSDGSTASLTGSATYSATGGTITAGGLYMAGITAGSSYRVIASSGSRADTASITITAVAPILQSVSLTPASVSLTAGTTQQFSVTGAYSDGSTASLTSSAAYSATGGAITAGGLYTAGSTPGSAFRVIASSSGRADTSTVTVTVAAPAQNPGQVTDLAVTSTDTSSATLRFTEVDDGTGAPARYQIRYYEGVMGWNWGAATPVSEGTCADVVEGTSIGGTRSCTVSNLAASTRYDVQLVAYRGVLNAGAVHGLLSNLATGTTTAVNGGSGVLAISPAGGTLNAVGATLQLAATATDASGAPVVNPGITWSSEDPSVATVNANGLVTARAAGSAVITALAACCAADEVTVNVQQQVATVTVSPATASVSIGANTQLSAVARDANGNVVTGVSFTWSSGSPSIATVNNGVVTGVAAGTAMISASGGGQSGTASVSVSAPAGLTTYFSEGFENSSFDSRGWYDNISPVTTSAHAGSGSRSLEMYFPQGATVPVNGGAMRHAFPESEAVRLRYLVKLSPNWVGSGQNYHPHEMLLLTNEDGAWVGPSSTRLTAYVEHNYESNGGYPVLAIQDSRNIDQSRIGQDLTNVTENRAVAGCNGNTDGHNGGCYSTGSQYANEKKWVANQPSFLPSPGAGYKGDWHEVEAYFQMNSIVDGKGVPDGVVRYWVDGKLVIEHTDVLLRTGARPNQKFNQFMIGYYIGDGSPVDQAVWIDDITVSGRQ